MIANPQPDFLAPDKNIRLPLIGMKRRLICATEMSEVFKHLVVFWVWKRKLISAFSQP